MRVTIAPLLYILALFVTSFSGSLFYLFPTLPLIQLNRKWFRFFGDFFVGIWTGLPVSLSYYLLGIQVHAFGDVIKSNERSLFIMNHRTRLDWMFLWSALFRCDPWLLFSEKIVLKSPLKKIPGAGWAMEYNAFVFLERKLNIDEQIMTDSSRYLMSREKQYQVLFFPEGTDLTDHTRTLSNKFADVHNLTRFDFLLQPRATGFLHMVRELNSSGLLESICDITVAYPDKIAQTELDLLSGEYPRNICFLIRRYSISSIPINDEQKLEQWLRAIWTEKEATLRYFYDNKHFEGYDAAAVALSNTEKMYMFLVICFWVFSLMLYCFLFYLCWQCAMFVVVLAIISVSFIRKFYGGIERLEILLDKQISLKSI